MADPTSTADGVPGPSSTKPYLIRAIYEWCTDNGYTPYVAVLVDERTQVPREHIKDGEIVLNVSPMATSRLKFGNEWLEFSARWRYLRGHVVASPETKLPLSKDLMAAHYCCLA